jgi:chromosome partitioning protein
MIITVASFKGGTGKTTTAIHLSAFLASQRGAGRVVLADGDPNRSAASWYDRGEHQAKFVVVDGEDDPGDFQHLVIDTPARTEPADLLPLAESSTLLIIPTSIAIFSLEATIATLGSLPSLAANQYRVLLTMLPPRGYKREEAAREALTEAGLPLFNAGIKSRTLYQDAELEAVTVNEMKGEAAAASWIDYQVLGKEILKGWHKK